MLAYNALKGCFFFEKDLVFGHFDLLPTLAPLFCLNLNPALYEGEDDRGCMRYNEHYAYSVK
jgi:hypothetical protein